MMRWMACTSLIVLAACGGGAGEENKAATKAASLAPGQWELTSEVTAFSKIDQGATPQINTPVGTRATESVCVSEGRPPAALFAGAGYDCRYDIYYARNGRLNTTMICRREGLSGSIATSADGNFGTDTIEYTRDMRTSLSGDGDVQIAARVTGRRTGECTPEVDGNQTAATEE